MTRRNTAKMRFLILTLCLMHSYWISCIVLTPDLFSLIEDPEVANLVEEFGRICEGTRLCVVNVSHLSNMPTDTDKGIPVPCCEPCRCDINCHVTHNCCPDYLGRILGEDEVVTINENPRRCNQVEYPLQSSMTDRTIDSFEMVSMCPTDFSEKKVKEKCETRYDELEVSQKNKAGIIEIIPVSDSTTLIPYKNIYCAICSGINVNQLVLWDTVVDCSNPQPFLFHNGTVEVQWLSARNDCILAYTPPESVETGVKQCDYMIDRCNYTGRYNGENPFFERSCASYTSIYKQYKNVHCYLCSGNPEESFIDECFLTSYGKMVGFTGTLRFDELLSDLEKEYNEQHNKDVVTVCDSQSFYVNSTGTCVPIVCSDLMILNGLTCRPYYSNAYQISYTTRTRLFPRPDFTEFENYLQLMDNIKASLSTIENMGSLDLCFYQYDIYLNISEEQLLERETLAQASAVYIDVRVSYCLNSKGNSDVLTEIQKVLKVYEEISNHSNGFSIEYIAENYEDVIDLMAENLEVKLVPPYFSYIMQYKITKNNLAKITVLSSIMMAPSHYSIPVSKLQFCAKVMLTVDSRVVTRHMDENDAPIVKVLGEEVNATDVIVSADGYKIMICAEKYDKLIKKQEARVLNGNKEPTSGATLMMLKKFFTFLSVFLVMKLN